MTKTVVCMNWGTMYGPEYVNRLYSMVARNITGPFKVVCLTDSTKGMRKELECHPCPTIRIPPPRDNWGWRKLCTWATNVDGLTTGEHALFLDLDLVITASIDPFFEYRPDCDFIVIENWSQLNQRMGNTSVYRFKVGKYPHLLSDFEDNHEQRLIEWRTEQAYVSAMIPEMEFWPEEWCCNFKNHCIPRGVKRYFVEPRMPEGAKIVAFTGQPNPPEAAVGRWPSPWYKRIYKQLRPAPWVAQHWQ